MTKRRDPYVDFLRAFSLVVVVIWHWAFTILELSPQRVSPSNPIGFTRGMWATTWLLQVMPVFFFVGGFTHRLAFDNYRRGDSRRFLKRRTRRLLLPASALVAVWVALGFVIAGTLEAEWTWSAVILVLSPLWFLVVYLVLVLIAPLAIRAHWRWGELVLVWLVGLAAVLDVLRFHHLQGWAAWMNFIVIWGLAHQLGFFYDRLVAAPRRVGWMFFWGGLFGLVALTNMGFYPRSVVGVPGERFSNMGPPTLAIVALTLLQVGLVLLARDWVMTKLDTSPAWQRTFRWVNGNSLPLYLLHTTGMALAIVVIFVATDYLPPAEPNAEWWLTRPIWLIAPALATYPFLVLYARVTEPRDSREHSPTS
ncbi:MAG: acyltransferase family protein [Acidimicrobiia bacterium]|nr:acyltransferase family protein [Acidimicrobiia bacterium]